MSERPADHHPLPLDAEETVDAVPVADEVRALDRPRASLPAVRAAAVAATGFVVGAATVVAISHQARTRPGGLLGRSRGRGRRVDQRPIVATRSLLIDIHLLGEE